MSQLIRRSWPVSSGKGQLPTRKRILIQDCTERRSRACFKLSPTLFKIALTGLRKSVPRDVVHKTALVSALGIGAAVDPVRVVLYQVMISYGGWRRVLQPEIQCFYWAFALWQVRCSGVIVLLWLGRFLPKPLCHTVRASPLTQVRGQLPCNQRLYRLSRSVIDVQGYKFEAGGVDLLDLCRAYRNRRTTTGSDDDPKGPDEGDCWRRQLRGTSSSWMEGDDVTVEGRETLKAV